MILKFKKSKDQRARDVWVGKTIMSNLNSWACYIASKVT